MRAIALQVLLDDLLVGRESAHLKATDNGIRIVLVKLSEELVLQTGVARSLAVARARDTRRKCEDFHDESRILSGFLSNLISGHLQLLQPLVNEVAGEVPARRSWSADGGSWSRRRIEESPSHRVKLTEAAPER